jgi:lysophospholipase L1-like esterase
LGLSVALNLILYERLRNYYTLLYASKLDPLGLAFFENSAGQQGVPDGKPVLVFFGDSRAAQWPDPPIDTYQIVNMGIGNQTSAQVAGRFDEHIRPLQPEIVVLQVGINDLKTIPLFPESKQDIILRCQANIQTIIQNSLEMGSSVIITTIFPTGEIPLHRRLVWSDDVDYAVEEVNNYIRGLAQNHVIVFDTAKILADTNGQIKQEYSFDELHLNAAGYQTLNPDLIEILENIK